MVKGIEVPIPEEMMTCPDCQGLLVLLPEGVMLFLKGRVASTKHTLRCTKCKAKHTHYVDNPEVTSNGRVGFTAGDDGEIVTKTSVSHPDKEIKVSATRTWQGAQTVN